MHIATSARLLSTRAGRDKVVTAHLRKLQKSGGYPYTNQVRAEVGCIGIATAVAKKAGQRIIGAGNQIGAQYIFGGHGSSWCAQALLVDLTIVIAEATRAETSVMLLGTIKVVAASAATRE